MIQGFLNPSQVLKQLKLRKNIVAADFGCGSGGWAIPLAKILEEGKVYAIDILEEPLSALRAKSKIEKIFNIETKKSDVEKGTTLLAESCHLVLMTNLLFEAENKKTVLEEGKRVLKKGGKILVVDWTPIPPPPEGPVKREGGGRVASQPPAGPLLGPAPEKRVSAEEVKKIAQDIDLKLEKEFEAGTYHWGLIFEKP